MTISTPTTSQKASWKKRLAAALVLAAFSTALVACNTTEGVGKDIKSAGKGIEETAQDAK